VKLLKQPLWLLLLLSLAAAAPSHAQRERLSPEDREYVEQKWPGAKRTSTSIRYIILKEGDPQAGRPRQGQYVSVLFKGMLLNGKIFDQVLDPGRPFKMRIGREGLIAGWEQTLPQMNKGEKRLIIIPYELAYGEKGRAPDIPRRATLVFEIELLDWSDK
jgi:FKBP-type peptidyl-prolyl cis-trans isomerase